MYNLVKTGLFSRDSIYESTLKELLKKDSINQWLRAFTQPPWTDCVLTNHAFLLKDDTRTPSGTFKFRGASLLLDQMVQTKNKSIIATSTGNHGISLAMLSRNKGISITICVPENIVQEKKDKMTSYGASVIKYGKDLNETMVFARELAISSGNEFVSSVDELLAIGHSTLLSEARNQNSHFKKIYFPIGVGSGIAGQILSNLINGESIEIIGVVHEAHSAWAESLSHGMAVHKECNVSLAPGMMISKPNDEVFGFVQRHIKDIVVINDANLINAVKLFQNITINNGDLTSLASIAAASKYNDFSPEVLTVLC